MEEIACLADLALRRLDSASVTVEVAKFHYQNRVDWTNHPGALKIGNAGVSRDKTGQFVHLEVVGRVALLALVVVVETLQTVRD
jgi:hypothetical protein